MKLTNNLGYPSSFQVWIRSQYEAHAGSTYSPIGSLANTSGNTWEGSFGNVQQNLVLVGNFGVGESCLDGGPFELAFIDADAPPAAAPSPPPSSSPSSSGGPSRSGTPSTSTSDSPQAQATTLSPAGVALQQITIDGKTSIPTGSVTISSSQSLLLSGTGAPNSTVKLTIHSTPKTVTVTTDSSGKWNYTISGLSPGDHYVEASQADSTGSFSTPTKVLSFKVVQSKTAAIVSTSAGAKKHTALWITIGLAVIILGALLAFALRSGKIVRLRQKPKAKAEKDQTPPKDSATSK